MKKIKIEQRSVIGIFVILVGTILLLSSMNIINANLDIGTFWPVVLIVTGIIRVVNFDQSSFFGFVLVLIGVFFQLRNLNVPFMDNINFTKIFWPGMVILFGLSLILPDKFKSKQYDTTTNDYSDIKNSVNVEYDEDEF